MSCALDEADLNRDWEIRRLRDLNDLPIFQSHLYQETIHNTQ
jgi:hypothetical protein